MSQFGAISHAPPNFGQLRFLGQQEKFGETKFLQSFHVLFRLFFSLKELFFISRSSRRGKAS